MIKVRRRDEAMKHKSPTVSDEALAREEAVSLKATIRYLHFYYGA
jgi:hypothetical protein